MGEKLAAIGTGAPPAAVAWSWLGHATDVMQFVVLLIGAASGIASAIYYIRKARDLRKGEK